MNKTRVFLADDHKLMRSGLRLLLNTQEDLDVIGESGDVAGTLQQVAETRPDLLLLDLSMPGGECIETIRSLMLQNPTLRILVVTMHNDRGLLQRTLEAGACGVVVKSSADSDLLTAIRAVLQGQRYLSLGESSPGSSELPAVPQLQSLSAREREVLQLLVRGHTNQAIADLLGVGVKSIESYRARMMAKLGVSTRAELVEIAVRSGIFFENSQERGVVP